MANRKLDLTGNTYGKLTVLYETNSKGYRRMWFCTCDCGNTTIVDQSALRKKIPTESCGCLQKQATTIHGDWKAPLYSVHKGMINRCYDLSHNAYNNYGARGITVCDEWRYSYIKFKQWAMTHGYKNTLTIDRRNNNKGYSPDNCQWVNRSMQQRNTRKRGGATSQYKGVCFDKARQKWKAEIATNSKRTTIGRFTSEIAAAQARDKYIKDNKLKGYTLNF